MSHEEAVRAAHLELGGAAFVKEQVRDVGWERIFGSVRQDLRYAARMIQRFPGLTVVLLLTIALSTGANTAIFTLLNAVVLRPLPVTAAGRLVEVLTRYDQTPVSGLQAQYFEQFRDTNSVFDTLFALSSSRVVVALDGREPESLTGTYISSSAFAALQMLPSAGRLFDVQDEEPGAAAVVLVSGVYWAKQGRDAGLVGRKVFINNKSATVIGVMPAGFLGFQVGSPTDVWLPMQAPLSRMPGQPAEGGHPWVQAIGVLRPGVSVAEARAALRVFDRVRRNELARTQPSLTESTLELRNAPAGLSGLRDHFATPLLVIMSAVSLLVMIACANIAGLLLARSAAREREIATRLALGASRSRIIRQVLTESLLLSIIGSAAGIVIATMATRGIARILASGRPLVGMPGVLTLDVGLDVRVFVFALAAAIITGIACGLAPAWSASAASPARSLADTTKVGDPPRRARLSTSLVVLQVALSVTTLALAGNAIRYLADLRSRDLGFRTESVQLLALEATHTDRSREQLATLYGELLTRFKAVPGVTSATLSGITPIEGPGAARRVVVNGYVAAPTESTDVALNWVAPGYFTTFGIQLLSGRDFTVADERAERVAIVSQATAHRFFAGKNPVGQRFAFEGQSDRYLIIGVAADAKYSDLHEPAPQMAYLHAFQEGRGRFSQFALKTAGVRITPAVLEDVVRGLAPGLTISRSTTLSTQLNASIVAERLVATLSGLFAVLGALLAGLGLFGLLAFMVARRTPEIGLRVALGATGPAVLRLVISRALIAVMTGCALGAMIASASDSLIARLMSVEHMSSPAVVASSVFVMLCVAVLAVCIPASRAVRLTPIEALR